MPFDVGWLRLTQEGGGLVFLDSGICFGQGTLF